MEFSAFAEKETSALIARILAESSEASRQRVEALRAALDSAAKAVEAVVGQTPDTQAQVADLVASLRRPRPPRPTRGSNACRRKPARSPTPSAPTSKKRTSQRRKALEGSLKDALGQLDGVRSELARTGRGPGRRWSSRLTEARDQTDAAAPSSAISRRSSSAQAQEKDALAAALARGPREGERAWRRAERGREARGTPSAPARRGATRSSSARRRPARRDRHAAERREREGRARNRASGRAQPDRDRARRGPEAKSLERSFAPRTT